MFGSISSVWNNYQEEIWKGVGTTLWISLWSIVFGMLIGFCIGFIRHIHISRKDVKATIYGKRFFKLIFDVYVAIFRYTPFLTQAFFFYYVFFVGASNVLLVGIIVLSLNVSAFMAIIMEGGIKSVDPGQYAAGRSLGLSHLRTYLTIVMPQAFKNMVPPLSNEIVNTIKATSILSVIGVSDLMFKIKQANGATYDFAAGFTIAFLIYFVICLIFVLLLKGFAKVVERRH